MAGFLNAFIPLAQVAGDTAGTIGASEQRKQALGQLVGTLGPDYSQFGKAVSAGVSPDVAMSVLQQAHQQKAAADFARMYQQAGSLTPDVIAYGLRTGALDPKSIPSLTKNQQAGQGRAADLASLDQMIAAETDPAKKAMLTSLRPAVEANGFASISGLLNSYTKPPTPTKLEGKTAVGVDAQGNPITSFYNYDPTKGTYTAAPVAGPASGGAGPLIEAGGIRRAPNAQQQMVVNSAVEVRQLIPNLIDAVRQLPNQDQVGEQSKQYGLYRIGNADPAWTNYFDLLGQVQAELTPGAMGGQRGKWLYKDLHQHIPSPYWDTPVSALKKLQTFDANRFATDLNRFTGNPNLGRITPNADIDATGSALPPPPPFNYDKVYQDPTGNYIAHNADDGKNYIVRGSAWVPDSR